MRNRVVVFCTDGIVHRTTLGKVHYYPDSSILGYYYVSHDLCIKTNHGTVALNNSCTNYRTVKTVVGKYPRLH